MTDYEKIIREIKDENRKLRLLINDLVKSNNELQQKLSYYENPHSPPSTNSLQWKKQKARQGKNNEPSKRGGVPGHKGATQIFTSQKRKHHILSVYKELD